MSKTGAKVIADARRSGEETAEKKVKTVYKDPPPMWPKKYGIYKYRSSL